jgi:DNA-binding CsgD family transcriptional regulator
MAEFLIDADDLGTIAVLLTSPPAADCEVLPPGILRSLAALFPGAVAGVFEIDESRHAVLRTETFPPDPEPVTGESLAVTFPGYHPAHLVRVCVRRGHPPFSIRDRVLFRLLAPRLAELVVGQRHHHDGEPLSPSERRVLELVARGASNSEVSESLSVSVATVRKHLEHIYAKLGVRNRTAAAAHLSSLHLDA